MSEKKIVFMSYKEQKEVKPVIEDAITEFLDGDMKRNALDIIAYLRDSKISPRWCLTNWWNSSCKGKSICKIHLSDNGWAKTGRSKTYSWHIASYLQYMDKYKETIMNEGLQNIIWDHFAYWRGCLTRCSNWTTTGRDITILGKEFKDLCGCATWRICVHDPDEITLNSVKRLLELEKRARNEK